MLSNKLRKQISEVKTLNQANKVLKPMLLNGELELWLKVHHNTAEFFLGHDMLVFKTDLESSGYNSIEYTERTPNNDPSVKHAFDVHRTIRTEQRISSRGFIEFWRMVNDYSLGLLEK